MTAAATATARTSAHGRRVKVGSEKTTSAISPALMKGVTRSTRPWGWNGFRGGASSEADGMLVPVDYRAVNSRINALRRDLERSHSARGGLSVDHAPATDLGRSGCSVPVGRAL